MISEAVLKQTHFPVPFTMQHDRSFDPRYGEPVELEPGLRRLTVKNPGPFTFFGTNTYLIGTQSMIVLDPGPADPEHLRSILDAAGQDGVAAILVSHTHMDHSPGARQLKEATGAPIVGCGVHSAARSLRSGEINPLDASADTGHVPDRQLRHGDTFEAAGVRLEAVATPGHTDNHLCFALSGTQTLFSADHVMAWSTSIVAPPDGNMRAYMESLETLLGRDEDVYLPGHGGPLQNAKSYTRDLRQHRRNREAAVLNALTAGPAAIPDLVLEIYKGLDPALYPAAGLSLFAHLEDLVSRKLVSAEPAPTLSARYCRL